MENTGDETMAEDRCDIKDCIMVGEIKNINEKLSDFKEAAEKQTDKMLDMRDSKMKTEWTLETIQLKQVADAKTYSENIKALFDAIEAMKNEKVNMWKQLGWIAKTTIVTTIITTLAGNVYGLIKVLVLTK